MQKYTIVRVDIPLRTNCCKFSFLASFFVVYVVSPCIYLIIRVTFYDSGGRGASLITKFGWGAARKRGHVNIN